MSLADIGHFRSQARVCGHSARQNYLVEAEVQRRFFGVFAQASDDRLDIRRAEIGHAYLLALLLCVVDNIDGSSLESGKAEIIFASVNMRTRELVALRVAVLGHSVEVHAAGIIEPHGARRLVHRLACRVVARSADDMKIRVVAHLDYVAVTA